MKKNRHKCVDSQQGSKIPLEIVFSIGAGKVPFPTDLQQEPVLSSEARSHLRICESCRDDLRENLALWYRKGMASYRTNQAYGIVTAASSGDSTILRRNISSGVAFFKLREGSTTGLFVLVTDGHSIHDAEEKTLEEFNNMS